MLSSPGCDWRESPASQVMALKGLLDVFVWMATPKGKGFASAVNASCDIICSATKICAQENKQQRANTSE
eukprot:697666-Amphidinium_carterae.1